MIDKTRIEVIGFDLDGTLYELTPEMNDRVRTQIANRILEKKPDLSDTNRAREYFEQRYTTLQTGTGVLEEVGHKNASQVMDDCLATANVVDLLQRDDRLIEIMGELHKRYALFLLTSSPRELSGRKLEALGIDINNFRYAGYSDTPGIGSKSEGTAFYHVISQLGGKTYNYAFVGDRPKSDILPPKKLGMQTIAIGKEVPEADASIPKITDLGGLLL